MLAVLERAEVLHVEDQKDDIGPLDVILVLLINVILLSTLTLFLLQLVLAHKIPYFVIVDKLFAYNCLCENVAILVWGLLYLNSFAFIEVHVSQEKTCLSDIFSA